MLKDISLFFNIRKIESGELLELIPEFYELKAVVEDNSWHYKENIFIHSLAVFNNLQEILYSLNQNAKQFMNNKISLYLEKIHSKLLHYFMISLKKQRLLIVDK